MKPSSKSLKRFAALSAAGGSLLLVAAAIASPATPHTSAPPNKYIGAAKCKNCHKEDSVGNQFGAWEKAKHSGAFETLASDAAKKIAADMGIENAQESEQCLKCHTTAHGADPKEIKRGFKVEMGVQCESCHGPGDDHSKARFKAAAAGEENPQVEPGEIISEISEDTCTKCHNSESPTFKAFCFPSMYRKIAHLRPDSTLEEVDCTSCHDPVPEEQ